MRKTWDTGNFFAIPMPDSSFAIGQVVGREAEVMNSITCAFFNIRVKSLSEVTLPSNDSVISVQFITKDLLTKRIWKVVGKDEVRMPKEYYPYEDKRSSGWVGARVIGSGIIEEFLQAYFCLNDWNVMKDPYYFDKLLLDPKLKPNNLKYKKG